MHTHRLAGASAITYRPDADPRCMVDRAVLGQMAARGWLVEGDGPHAVVMCAPH